MPGDKSVFVRKIGSKRNPEENRDKQKNNATETDHHADNGILRKRKRKSGGGEQDRKRSDNRFHETGI